MEQIIVEAKSASSKRDFIRFYEIALKSANEIKYWLGLLRDATEIDKTKIENLLKEVNEISNILASSLLTMKGKNRFDL
ncbi:MAG: four helix bundle protein [Patescibacteria group bacterium]|nr:four helix bundle protein [Patescibacteria group bacterium]